MNLFPLIFGKDVCINEKEKVFYGIQNGKTIYVSGTSGIIIFTIGLIISAYSGNSVFTDKLGWNVGRKTFVGFQNYIDLMKDSDFWNAWWFTIKFTIGNTIIQNVVALLFGSCTG